MRYSDPELPKASTPRPKPDPKAPRQAPPLFRPALRANSPAEVALGFTEEQARAEAMRCLQCANPVCINACLLGD
jgi:glutamate synthase (NADPH) small chain